MKTRSQNSSPSSKTGNSIRCVRKSRQPQTTRSTVGAPVSMNKVLPRKAPKFSWVVDGLLAAHGRPAQHGHVQYLCEQGIDLLITLTENKPRALREYPGQGLQWKHIPVKDEKPPSVEQACEFVSTVDETERLRKKVSVHCAWGRGRTGTLLACYLAKRQGLTAEQAITKVRNLRPGSIDTKDQEQTVQDYVTSLKQ